MFSDYVKQHQERYKNVFIARFNPWFYEDAGALVTSFFATIAAELGRDKGSPWNQAATALKAMGTFLTVASKGISLFGVNVDGGIVKEALNAGVETFNKVGEFSGGLAGLAELADGGQKKLEEHRATVEAVLKRLGKTGGRIVVQIDDVDRLNKAELLGLLRLIRTVADLPCMTLMVAMDDERIRDVLSDAISEGYGQGYLDKIVQVPLHVPLPERRVMLNELVTQLRATLSSRGLELPDDLAPNQFFEPEALGRLVSLVRTPRSLARYINGVRTLLLAGEDPDVHPSDAVLIEALHIFYPDVYDRVRRHKRFLTESPGSDFNFEFSESRGREQVRVARSATLDLLVRGGVTPLEASTEESVRGLLKLLFGDVADPDLHRDRVSDLAERRVRSPKVFDNYFRCAPAMGVVIRRDVEALFEKLQAQAQAGSKIGVAEVLTVAFTGLGEPAADQMLDDLGHRLMAVRFELLEQIGEGVIASTGSIAPDIVRRLLIRVLDATTNIRLVLGGARTEAAVKAQACQLVRAAIQSRIPIEQLHKLLKKQGGTWLGDEDLKSLVAEWLLRVDAELREGDPFGGADWAKTAEAVAFAFERVTALGEASPVSQNAFRSHLVDYVVRQPERLPQVLCVVAWVINSGVPRLLIPNRPREESIASLQRVFGDYEQLRPAYEAFLARNLDAGPFKLFVDDLGELL
jgi:hypothetical protein